MPDVGLHLVAHPQGPEHLVFEQQAGIPVVHNHLITQVGALPHQHIDLVSGRERRLLVLAKVALYLGRGHDAVAFVVQVHVHHVAAAHLHALALLAEGDEEVLHQPPIQESAILVDPCHAQAGKVAHLRQRLLRGGHQPLFIVQVEKDVQLVAHLAPLGHVARREQDAPLLSAIQVHAEIDLLHHFQDVESS